MSEEQSSSTKDKGEKKRKEKGKLSKSVRNYKKREVGQANSSNNNSTHHDHNAAAGGISPRSTLQPTRTVNEDKEDRERRRTKREKKEKDHNNKKDNGNEKPKTDSKSSEKSEKSENKIDVAKSEIKRDHHEDKETSFTTVSGLSKSRSEIRDTTTKQPDVKSHPEKSEKEEQQQNGEIKNHNSLPDSKEEQQQQQPKIRIGESKEEPYIPKRTFNKDSRRLSIGGKISGAVRKTLKNKKSAAEFTIERREVTIERKEPKTQSGEVEIQRKISSPGKGEPSSPKSAPGTSPDPTTKITRILNTSDSNSSSSSSSTTTSSSMTNGGDGKLGNSSSSNPNAVKKELVASQKYISAELEIQTREAFEMYDFQSKQTVSKSDVGAVVRSIGLNPSEDQLTKAMKQLENESKEEKEEKDKKNNDGITFKQMCELVGVISKNKLGEGLILSGLEQVFDRNRTGKIGMLDLKQLVFSMGEHLTERELEVMENSAEDFMDENGNVQYKNWIKQLTALTGTGGAK